MACKVLMIDDEPDLIAAVKDWLEPRDFEVSAALNGLEGLRKAKRIIPGIIILDIRMPIMDGFEVLDRLRSDADTRYIPVIMLTQKRESDSIFRARNLGMTDYMMKPFSMEKLLELVKRYSLYR